jgi:CO/xanthine dehydrogenase Mo-binding subunit
VTELDRIIGTRLPRIDGRAKVSGGAKYVDDLYRPGMLHAALLGSPYAHARILSYDLSAARALRGVKAVIAAEDLPANNIGIAVTDEPVLARGKVRYVGEPVAAVAAEDLATARAALRLIDVRYQELTAVFDPREALAEDAPLLHEDFDSYHKTFSAPSKGNMLSFMEVSTGDLGQGWRQSDVIVEGDYETPAIHPQYIEPCGALAEVDGSGKVTIWSSTQSVFISQSDVCRALGLPMAKVRCIATPIGGGFGGKQGANEAVTAALALATARPVKLVLSREDDMIMMRSRHASKIHMKTGATRDGTLVCRQTEVLFDAGAYCDLSPYVPMYTVVMAHGPYRIPNLHTVARTVYTNRLRATSIRGFGTIQPIFAAEGQLDELARELGMDPIDLRIKNAIRSGDKWLGSIEVPVGSTIACLEEIRRHPRWSARRERPATPGKKRGFGVAASVQRGGVFSASATIRLAEDGSVTLNTAYIDIGGGSDTALVQICAATLGIDVERINLVAADTDGGVYDFGAAADRGTSQVGLEVQLAAEQVKEQLLKYAGEMLECAPRDLEFRPGGRVGIKGVPQPELTFSDIALRGLYASGGPIIGTHASKVENSLLDPAKTRSVGLDGAAMGAHFEFAAHAVEVEVDEATGQVELVQGWCAIDVGRVINALGVDGQLIGGFVQGVGTALFEELVWDGGRLANPSLMDYKIPGTLDVPYQIHRSVLENPEPGTPWGARGMGDLCINGPAPAIANAIADAVGVQLHQLPMTSERVLRAMIGEGLLGSGPNRTQGAA